MFGIPGQHTQQIEQTSNKLFFIYTRQISKNFQLFLYLVLCKSLGQME